MESEQNYNLFITTVVTEYNNTIAQVSKTLSGFPYGGNGRVYDSALLSGDMKKALLLSVPGITTLINNVANLQSSVSDLASKGALSELSRRLKAWNVQISVAIKRIDSWTKAEGLAGMQLVQYVMDAARDVSNEMVTVGCYMRDDNNRDVKIPKKLR